MAAPSKVEQRRRDFLPLLAAAFVELGYRGTTTAELAARCGVRENVLYRVWPSKKSMFLAAVEFVYTVTMRNWDAFAAAEDGDAASGTAAQRILEHQAEDHGRMRLYRIVFAGLAEDDPEIKTALHDVYQRLHAFAAAQIAEHRRGPRRRDKSPPAELAAWALIGLGLVVDLQRELEILPVGRRKSLMRDVGRTILDGK